MTGDQFTTSTNTLKFKWGIKWKPIKFKLFSSYNAFPLRNLKPENAIL